MNRTDVLVAAVVTAVALAGLLVGTLVAEQPLYDLDVQSVLLASGQGVVLLWRRRFPIPVLVVASMIVAVHTFAGHPNASAELGPFVAAYAVGAHSRFRVGGVAVVAAAALASWVPHSHAGISPALAVDTGQGPPDAIAAAITNTALFAAAFLLGWAVRSRRETAVARLEAALAEERTRIARELHDVIAHHVGAMVIHAGAGRRMLDKDADVERAAEAFAQIEASGRSALTAVPVLVGALRQDAGDHTAPQPTLARLDEITEAAARAGLTVNVEVNGTPRQLPASVELSAYRIVQEAMTNAAKHAGPSTVNIRLSYFPDSLDITVVDDGRGCSADIPSGRYGLAGMRERATLLGGRFEAGPRPEGGFSVHAWLPVGAA